MPSIPELTHSSSLIFSGKVVERGISTVPAMTPNDRLLTGKQSLPGGVGEWDEKCVATPLMGNAAMTGLRTVLDHAIDVRNGGHRDGFSARRQEPTQSLVDQHLH